MSKSERYISERIRTLIKQKANFRCEYCLIHENDAYFGCEVDHIISLKHGGRSNIENLAFACFPCNRSKGSDIGSISSNAFFRFYNPRIDKWSDHFIIKGAKIIATSSIGEVTSQIFQFNIEERTLERKTLMKAGKFPS